MIDVSRLEDGEGLAGKDCEAARHVRDVVFLIRSLRAPAWLFAMAASVCPLPASADPVTPTAHLADTQLRDPSKEAEAKALMLTLRCLVCQGQSIADSDASMAGDMRALVRERIAAGERPESIRQWLVRRYGDYVTYDPPLSGVTWPLWLAPVAMIAIGGWVARSTFKQRRV